jgi:hypothetical protein
MNAIRSVIKPTSVLALLALVMLYVAPVHAAMVSTESLLNAETQAVERSQLLSMLERAEVQAQLEALGVDTQDAKARVQALTDAEVAELNARMAELPAGGDVLAVVLIIFLVFVITDVIGATDIFPFIHPVNNK